MWGVLFLDETVTLPMLAGAVMIIAGTAAVLRRTPVPGGERIDSEMTRAR
jgi:drug/metabolite transporter (DMT)-like permease